MYMYKYNFFTLGSTTFKDYFTDFRLNQSSRWANLCKKGKPQHGLSRTQTQSGKGFNTLKPMLLSSQSEWPLF